MAINYITPKLEDQRHQFKNYENKNNGHSSNSAPAFTGAVDTLIAAHSVY